MERVKWENGGRRDRREERMSVSWNLSCGKVRANRPVSVLNSLLIQVIHHFNNNACLHSWELTGSKVQETQKTSHPMSPPRFTSTQTTITPSSCITEEFFSLTSSFICFASRHISNHMTDNKVIAIDLGFIIYILKRIYIGDFDAACKTEMTSLFLVVALITCTLHPSKPFCRSIHWVLAC